MKMGNAMSLVLAVDTACGSCSVALLEGVTLKARIHEQAASGQAALLVPMMEQALRKARAAYKDLACIISTVGPGGFTGVRIGLSTTRAAGLAAAVPVSGVTTLACMAYAAAKAYRVPAILALLNAGKGEAYFQIFSVQGGLKPLTEAGVGDSRVIEEAARGYDCLAVGYVEILSAGSIASVDAVRASNAEWAARLALECPDLCVAPEPLYIRPPDAVPSRLASARA